MKLHLKNLFASMAGTLANAMVATTVLLSVSAPFAYATPLQDLEASVEAEDATAQVELDRINAERRVLNARYAEEDKACFQKFAVTPCRDKLRAERRAKLDALRTQEVALNDAKRQRRSQLQREQVRQRELEAAERRADAARAAAEKAQTQPQQNAPLSSPGTPRGESAPRQPPKPRPPNVRTPPAPVDRSAQSAEERARYEQKQKEAAEHKAEIERRNAERDPAKQPKPLPVPQ
jgi:colicin import membrane protein